MGVLIIEGKIKSGAMITASCALEQGREVFCVPGQINNTRSEAPNSLIKDGAKLVQNVEDIVNELSINVKVKKEKKIMLKLSEVEKKVISYINQNPKTIDQISEKLSIGLPELSLLLVELESKKIIESIGGGKYTCQLDLCI